jgi:hypothetical protein
MASNCSVAPMDGDWRFSLEGADVRFVTCWFGHAVRPPQALAGSPSRGLRRRERTDGDVVSVRISE